jgi:hypothetical protein
MQEQGLLSATAPSYLHRVRLLLLPAPAAIVKPVDSYCLRNYSPSWALLLSRPDHASFELRLPALSTHAKELCRCLTLRCKVRLPRLLTRVHSHCP